MQKGLRNLAFCLCTKNSRGRAWPGVKGGRRLVVTFNSKLTHDNLNADEQNKDETVHCDLEIRSNLNTFGI